MTPHATRVLALAWRTQRPLVGWLVGAVALLPLIVAVVGG